MFQKTDPTPDESFNKKTTSKPAPAPSNTNNNKNNSNIANNVASVQPDSNPTPPAKSAAPKSLKLKKPTEKKSTESENQLPSNSNNDDRVLIKKSDEEVIDLTDSVYVVDVPTNVAFEMEGKKHASFFVY